MDSSPQKLDYRIMGEYSIAKSFKGILRIAHILELVQNEDDVYFNPTYYGIPKTLMNISGGTYESSEMGYATAIDAMNGSITRYSESNPKIQTDKLRIQRVPMTDSMGNYLNWNVGIEGVTIGSNEQINGNYIDLESFQQKDFIGRYKGENEFIWQEKYFPILEAGKLIIGLQDKEYQSNKYKVNEESGLLIENSSKLGQLIVENKYDKSSIKDKYELTNSNVTRTFINYDKSLDAQGNPINFRTIYSDNKSSVEEYDVFMYRQDDWDCHNYNYELEGAAEDDKLYRGNDKVLSNYTLIGNEGKRPIIKTIDAHVGIVNLKEYVHEMINKFMKSTLVEVPTGTIINQFCSLDKWHAYPDSGIGEDLYAGHRPSMMTKRDVGLLKSPNLDDSSSSPNAPFIQSTIMGASKKINRLINPNPTSSESIEDTSTTTNNDELIFESSGFYQEIIPLYKRDYVLCDGSIYTLFVYPPNFKTDLYPNRRPSIDRFMDLFFAIGYQYTDATYINDTFKYKWDRSKAAYKVVNGKNEIITHDNILRYSTPDGTPAFNKKRDKQFNEDRHAVFVEDFITMLFFDKLYEEFGKAGDVTYKWNYQEVCEEIKKWEIPEKYRITSFLGDSNDDISSNISGKKWQNRWSKSIKKGDKFVMELPYYNFKGEGNESLNIDEKLPIIRLGREVKTFGDPIKFYDMEVGKWTVIEAYKIPQIQYIIDIMLNYATPDTIAPIMNTYFKYNFQVPNLTNNVPSFIGSSGTQWSDNHYNRLREVESWSSSYSQKNYMHRHLLFVEPNEVNPSESPDGSGLKNADTRRPPQKYNLTTNANPSSYVASAACRGGKVFCNCNETESATFQFNNGDNPNYIWNELGAGSDKLSNLTINPQKTNSNGMIYTILQGDSNEKYHSWDTGSNRSTGKIDTNDMQQKLESVVNEVDLRQEVWNNESVTLDASFIDKRYEYDKSHWFGWEHCEDPRFESIEPNRGRTSEPVNSVVNNEALSIVRFDKNALNFSINTNGGEWFSPENIKMLPLIKL